MQSHIGLRGYRTGDQIRYSSGDHIVQANPQLFPTPPATPLDATTQRERMQRSQGTDFQLGERGANEANLSAIQEELVGWLADVGGPSQQPTTSGDNFYLIAHSQMSTPGSGWQDCAAVDAQGWARKRRHPTRRHRAEPTFFVPLHLAKGLNPAERPFPLAHQVPTTTRPSVPAPPPEWLKQELKQNLQSYDDCISLTARQQLQLAVVKAQRDEAILTKQARGGHRQRAKCGAFDSEVRIGPDKFHRTINKVLQRRFSLDLTEGGNPKIRELRKLSREEWGINAERLRQDAARLAWPDEELLFFLEYGFMDYSGNTPPICSFSPHQQKALRDFPAFLRQTQEEIDRGWIGPPQDHPPSIPFQVRPGSLDPKQSGDLRLVWNASWPAPGSRHSAAEIGDEWYPIAPNASKILHSALQFEWSEIESNNEAIQIMAEGAKASGAPLLGLTYDITKWFRQLATATLDLWKCNVQVSGGFREDKRMQMGRRSSAHSAQRTTFLLTALLQRAACEEGWGLREECALLSPQEGDQQKALKAWLKCRRKVKPEAAARYPPSGQSQACLVYFSSFQDDITVVALGRKAAKDATDGVIRILQHRYGVPLSTKEEASRDFAPTFTCIGATYELSNPHMIHCKPRREKLEKYSTMLATLKESGALVPLQDMQRFAGLHTFMARFLRNGEYYCNSAYCCLRATLHTARNLRPVSRALIADASEVLSLLQRNSLATLTADPIFAHPGRQGFSSDASGATGVDAEGWGVHLQGLLANGKWPEGIKRALASNKLSISPLELLAAAIAVSIAAHNTHKLPQRRQIILRNDSESGCVVIIFMRADSAPMLEALRIFKELQDTANISVLAQHIPSMENRIADSLSRGDWESATHDAGVRFGTSRAITPEKIATWCNRVLMSALQAARHIADTDH